MTEPAFSSSDRLLPVSSVGWEKALLIALWTIGCFSMALAFGSSSHILMVTALSGLCCLTFAAALGSLKVVDLRPLSKSPEWTSYQVYREKWLPELLLGVGLGVVLTGVTKLGYWVLLGAFPSVEQQASELYGMLGTKGSLLSALPFLVWVVVVEEIVWRGVVFSAFAKKWGRGIALLSCSLLYAVPQLSSGTWLLPVVALFFGFIWTAQRALGASLMSIVLTHLVWDLGIFYLFPVAQPA